MTAVCVNSVFQVSCTCASPPLATGDALITVTLMGASYPFRQGGRREGSQARAEGLFGLPAGRRRPCRVKARRAWATAANAALVQPPQPSVCPCPLYLPTPHRKCRRSGFSYETRRCSAQHPGSQHAIPETHDRRCECEIKQVNASSPHRDLK
jgi:hypothetical protein